MSDPRLKTDQGQRNLGEKAWQGSDLERQWGFCLNLMLIERAGAIIDTSPTCAQRPHVTIASKVSQQPQVLFPNPNQPSPTIGFSSAQDVIEDGVHHRPDNL